MHINAQCLNGVHLLERDEGSTGRDEKLPQLLLIHAMKFKENITISSKMFVPCPELLFLTYPIKFILQSLSFWEKGICYCLVITFCVNNYIQFNFFIPMYQTSKVEVDFVLSFTFSSS